MQRCTCPVLTELDSFVSYLSNVVDIFVLIAVLIMVVLWSFIVFGDFVLAGNHIFGMDFFQCFHKIDFEKG